MSTLEERIAQLAILTFETLPRKSKPRTLADGSREWVPMSAIVLVQDLGSEAEISTCVSLATGSKCLPISALPKCKGMALHDSHAEVLALRALNRFLLSEIQKTLDIFPSYTSPFVQWCNSTPESNAGNAKAQRQPFEIPSNIAIAMYSSEAPCGDASMDILMTSMPPNDTEPWVVPEQDLPVLHGRGYFSSLGVVRRKPSRADAEPTNSKSCTDKLAVKQFTSVLSFPTSCFIATTDASFLKVLVVPANKFSATGFGRAFGAAGRLSHIREQPQHHGQAHFFQTLKVPVEHAAFEFRKPNPVVLDAVHPYESTPKPKASNISALHVVCDSRKHGSSTITRETLLNGVREGYKWDSPNPLKSSVISRRSMWRGACDVIVTLQKNKACIDHSVTINETWLAQVHEIVNDSVTYRELKRRWAEETTEGKVARAIRQAVVGGLGGWVENTGDDEWGI